MDNLNRITQAVLLLGAAASMFLCLIAENIEEKQLQLLWAVWCVLGFHVSISSHKN